MLSVILAASFSFNATATGIEKGTPVEFMFAGANTDRAYETMFIVDRPLKDLARDLEAAGLPRGRAVDNLKCDLWPVGYEVSIKPAITNFVAITQPDGIYFNQFVYTGGTRDKNNVLCADSEMPASAMSFYSLSQSLFVMNGHYPQGDVYNSFQAAKELKKGESVRFTISWEARSMPKHLEFMVSITNVDAVIKTIKAESSKNSLDVKIGFDNSLSVENASGIAQLLDRLDSVIIKFNGVLGNGFYFRAFNPPTKWRVRKDRLCQPFELVVEENSEKLTYIDEDWTVEGDDPKLTPKTIEFAEVNQHLQTDTCFIFADAKLTLGRLLDVRNRMQSKYIRNWYVFVGK